MQKPASFNLQAVKEQIEEACVAAGKVKPQADAPCGRLPGVIVPRR